VVNGANSQFITMNDLVGKSYVFEDGNSITIAQIKKRDGNRYWVTYQIQQGPGIPQRLVMTIDEFIDTYGYLFDLDSSDIPPPPDD